MSLTKLQHKISLSRLLIYLVIICVSKKSLIKTDLPFNVPLSLTDGISCQSTSTGMKVVTFEVNMKQNL